MKPVFLSVLASAIMLAGIVEPNTVLAADAGFKGEYFNNPDPSDTPVLVRIDPAINFDWDHRAPDPSINGDNFSVRWTGTDTFSSGTYVFTVTSDDGVRLYIDDSLVLDDWVERGGIDTFERTMTSGDHTLRMEFFEKYGAAVAVLSYELTSVPSPSPSPSPSPVPTAGPSVIGNVGVGTTVSAPQELPKTGLPFLVWASLGLVPVGLRLIRFSKSKEELKDSPNYVWEERQFQRSS